ncbi:MAG TPA: hypothetical protein VIY86_01230, partial [Pirellulaceae bacterium]
MVLLMVEKSQVARQVVTNMMRNEKFRDRSLLAMNDVDSSAVMLQGELEFPESRDWSDLSKSRSALARERGRKRTPAELEIESALRRPVDVSFENEPLSAVIEKLAKMSGVNVYLDPEGLSAEGISSNQTVSLNLRKPISLKSALNLVLEPLHLAHFVDNEVLRITSEQARDNETVRESYPVADLVLPVPNFVPNNNVGLPGALREAHSLLGQGLLGGTVTQAPLTIVAQNQGAAAPLKNASVLAQMASMNYGGIPSAPVTGPATTANGAPGGGSLADFDTLINLITTTIEPDSWEDNGGTGTIAGFPTNLSLVVSNTQEVQEKIIELLEQLRRLQDLQITIEVRFITLNDNFFERIGVDFDFDLDDNTGLSLTQVQDLD